MDTTIENSIFTVEKRMNFFPPPPSCPGPQPTPIILYLDASKDQGKSSTISVVFRASKPWKHPQRIAAMLIFTGALLFPPPPSCPEPQPTPTILYLDALRDKWQGSNISVFHHLCHVQSLNPPLSYFTLMH
jgi:hypothetical protein